MTILVFELTWTGTIHAPGNSATIQTIAQACPDEAIRVHADASHLKELQGDARLAALGNVTFVPIALHAQHRGKTHIVSFGRFRDEFRALRQALKAAPRREPCLIMLLSATPTAILAASLLARSRTNLFVQIGLHGNLNEIGGWRPRNPLTRALDLRSMLQAPHPNRLRFLVLEDGIKAALATLLPSVAARTDVLPLPINPAEIPPDTAMTLSRPVRVGLVGQATKAKGIDTFLETARALKASHGDAIDFTVVGRAVPGADLAPFAVLAEPIATEHLPRAVFIARLAALHYVFLPFQPNYYDLSASGALIDAITWLKPVIATPLPIVAAMFDAFGDIGDLCADADAMRTALDRIVTEMDGARYDRQVQALRRLRDSRAPAALAATYRTILETRFRDAPFRTKPRPGATPSPPADAVHAVD